jgi:hypothetical protein
MNKMFLTLVALLGFCGAAHAAYPAPRSFQECTANVEAMILTMDTKNSVEGEEAKFKLYQMAMRGCRIKFGVN